MSRGEEFHAEVHSSDASGGVEVTLNPAASTATLTVDATQIVAVTDVSVISAAGGDIKVESITGDGTLTLFRGTLPATGVFTHRFHTPFFSLRGGTLQLTAPAGVIDLFLKGFLTH